MDSVLYLKACDSSDRDILYEWANEPLTRANSFNTKHIEYKEHCLWFESKMNNPNTFIYILYKDNNKIGIVRLDKYKEKEAEISYSIDKNYRGMGYSTKLLELAKEKAKLNGIGRIVAYVKKENTVSNFALLNSGYLKEEEKENNKYYFDIGEYNEED